MFFYSNTGTGVLNIFSDIDNYYRCYNSVPIRYIWFQSNKRFFSNESTFTFCNTFEKYPYSPTLDICTF